MIRAHEIRATLSERGWMLLPSGAGPEGAAFDAWSFVETLVGERPTMLERQPIRPVDGGRSFASTRGFTPLHTDSQDFLGAPPALQIMICAKPADSGGETLLVDAWSLIASLERSDPALHRALFSESRTIPFYFGAVSGPTVAEKRGSLVFTASPMPPSPTDHVGIAVHKAIAAATVTEVRVNRGEVLLVDNHRMLHGRQPFAGNDRSFLRILAWLPTPLSRPEHHLANARALGRATPASHRDHARDGDRIDAHRAAVIAEMVSGVPPAKLAAREGVPEAELYRWRNDVFATASLTPSR